MSSPRWTAHENRVELCSNIHNGETHSEWLEDAMVSADAYSASLAQPEPWELYDFVQRANGHMPNEVRLAADIRMQFDRDQGQESFELWAFPDEGPDHIVVAEFGVTPLVGDDWPRLRFMLAALKIRPETPWEIAGPLAGLAGDRKVAVG